MARLARYKEGMLVYVSQKVGGKCAVAGKVCGKRKAAKQAGCSKGMRGGGK